MKKAHNTYVSLLERTTWMHSSMKILFIFLLIFIFQIQIGVSYAQSIELSLETEKPSLVEVFKEIEKESTFLFNYKNEDVKGVAPHQRMKTGTIHELLDLALKNTNLVYTIQGRHISITKRSPAKAVQPKGYLIRGVVLDEFKLPLKGVTIAVKGENQTFQTDAEGKFSLNVPEKEHEILFSYVGYMGETVTVQHATSLTIILKKVPTDLDEVVVVGYGTQKKVNLTGAVSVIGSNDLKLKPVGQTSAALQGLAAGLTVRQTSGEPGEDGAEISMRGIGTLNNASPLVLIDGIEGSINNVDPNVIESISVLKDAASSAIYGSRAANGVILVTTKRGTQGKFKVSYNNYIGYQSPTDLPKMVGSVEYMKMLNEAYSNVGRAPLYTPEQIQGFEDQNGVNSDAFPNTDWQNLTLTKSGVQQNHFLNISGGSENLKTYTSFGYFNQDGLIDNSNFGRFTLRNNMDWKISDKFKVKMDIQFVRTKKVSPAIDNTGLIFQWMNSIPANQIGINGDGSWGVGWNGVNPIAYAKESGTFVNISPWGSLNASVIYTPTDWLTAEVNASPKYVESHFNNFTKPIQTYLPSGTPSFLNPTKSSLSQENINTMTHNFRGTVTANRTFSEHHFQLLLGATQEESRANNLLAYRDLVDINYPVLGTGSAANQNVGGGSTKWVLRSFFGRFNYDYKQRYLVELNMRRDGSSRFAKDNRWGTFPSISAGWRITEEAFMEGLKGRFLNNAKLRFSWGQLGNQNIFNDYYPYTTQMKIGITAMDGTVVNRASFADMPNSIVKWEVAESSDVGLDLTFLSNRLNVTADYYYRKTKDILLTLPIPYTLGLNAPYQNAGVVENKGWELTVGYKDKLGDFNYNIDFNLSDVKNKILDFKGQDQTSFIANREGYPIRSIYGYVADGFFQTDDEAAKSPTQFGNIKAGDIRYKDLNNDGKINNEDKRVIGNSIPRYTFGLNLAASYKGFDMSLFFQGVGKADGYLSGAGIFPFANSGGVAGSALEAFRDSWTPENPQAKFPRLTFGETNNEQISTFWLKDASYMRLKNVQIGYTFPKHILSSVNIQSVRLFASGANLFSMDNFWQGYNVESPIGSVQFYPQVKIYNVGVEINF